MSIVWSWGTWAILSLLGVSGALVRLKSYRGRTVPSVYHPAVGGLIVREIDECAVEVVDMS